MQPVHLGVRGSDSGRRSPANDVAFPRRACAKRRWKVGGPSSPHTTSRRVGLRIALGHVRVAPVTPPPDPRLVHHVLSGSAHAYVVGTMEWEFEQGSSVESRLPIYAANLDPEGALLVVRTSVLAPEGLRCSLVLLEEPVIRACWNSPHREGSVLFDDPVHGHTYRGGRRMNFVKEPPLVAIPARPPISPWSYREAVQDFTAWANIDRDGLVWTDPPSGGGDHDDHRRA